MESKLTIVITAFNSEKTIKKTLLSVMCELDKKTSIIIIYRKSTDSTFEIINDLCGGHDAVRVYQDEGKGIYPAYNQGLKYCQTEYICYLNSDDWLAENSLNLIHSNLKDNERWAVCFGVEYYENNSFVKKVSGRRNFPNFLVMPWAFPCTVMKTKFIRLVGGFDERYTLVSDYDLILKMISKYGEPRFANEYIYCFRRGGASSLKKSFVDIFNILYSHFGFLYAFLGIAFRLFAKFVSIFK
tara:strand:- start:455 stop:1180 length:726 start_codon:yes stop_codon:yes gene_type:complete